MFKANWIFILSAPRSGSTLLTRMLGNHLNIESPMELHLAGFETLGGRSEFYQGQEPLLVGLEKALEDIYTQEEAELIQGTLNASTPIKECYQALSEGTIKRYIIDKTVGYSMSLERLKTIVDLIDKPLFLFLRRHPAAVVESLVKNGITSVYDSVKQTLGEASTPEAISRYVWEHSNGNIDTFLETIPDRSICTVYYEDLVVNPKRCMAEICQWLNLEDNESLLDPYANSKNLKPFGRRGEGGLDPNFFNHSGIDKQLAYNWQEETIHHFDLKLLCKMQSYGYSHRKSDILALLNQLENKVESQNSLNALLEENSLATLSQEKISF